MVSLVPSTIPSTLKQAGAARFWIAVLLTGVLTGGAAAALTRLLEAVQRWIWGRLGHRFAGVCDACGSWQHRVIVLLAAGAVTGLGQLVLRRLSSGNGVDTTAAIWFYAGRLPALRTLGSAVLVLW